MGQRSLYLTEEADRIYRRWRDHGRSASRKVSAAIVRMWNQEDIVAALQPGDRRICVSGAEMVWVLDRGDGKAGFVGEKSTELNQSNIEWMKEQQRKVEE